MKLIKIRTSDSLLVARSLYADDQEYLKSINGNMNIALDSLLVIVNSFRESSFFFKVEDTGGALYGFFIVPKNNPGNITNLFFLKKNARIINYYTDFYKLVSETIFGGVTQSLGSINVEDINSVLKSTFTLNSNFKPNGTNINS